MIWTNSRKHIKTGLLLARRTLSLTLVLDFPLGDLLVWAYSRNYVLPNDVTAR